MEKRELILNIRETKEQARRRVYKSKKLQKTIAKRYFLVYDITKCK